MKQYIIRIWLAIRIYVIIALSITIGATAVFSYQEYKKLISEYDKSITIINEHFEKKDFKEDAAAVKASADVSPSEGEGEKSNLLPSWKIEKKIRQKFPEDPDTAVAIAKAESRLNPYTIGDKHMSKPSIGLFQISQIYHDYPTEELMDIDRNIQIAKKIYDEGGWSRWTTYRTGEYLAFKN
jgi:soluble lytic murein transglycosylase-like protein